MCVCPGFNSAVPALLSHYHTEQTECVCWVVKLSSAPWQSPFSNPPSPPSPQPLISSPAALCRLHTYTAYLSGSLCVCLHARVVESEGKHNSTYEAFSEGCRLRSESVHSKKHSFPSAYLQRVSRPRLPSVAARQSLCPTVCS